MSQHEFSRRGFLYTSGALMAWAFMPRIASAAPAGHDPRFVMIVLRGALDGLAAVAPRGDPDYERSRLGLVMPTEGAGAGIKLDGFFELNSNMPKFADLYRSQQGLIVHAAATPYRERSHFDGQDVLESGQTVPGRTDTGWLNRALAALPRGEAIAKRDALALGSEIPLIMRGQAHVVTLMPQGGIPPAPDTRARLLDLYTHTNPMLAQHLSDALNLESAVGGAEGMNAMGKASAAMGGDQQERAFRTAGMTAGKLLAKADGPRVGAMSLLGWDTHAAEGPLDGRLGKLLSALDQTIDGLRSELGDAWKQTVVAIATEFGRTVRMNGTSGTDHGTATTMFLAGGAIKGGRVLADWPGLSEKSLHEQRDLRPTTDSRSVFKGILRDHLGLPEKVLAEQIFPGSASVGPLAGLV
ncbi:MAG: DUF1501 domain-containing protein [Bauldia sp.]